MAVRTITAPPGWGKTLNMTRFALEIFDAENKKKKDGKYINCIYSNYPILLKRKKKFFQFFDGAGNVCNALKINEDGEMDNDGKYWGCFSNKIRFTDMRLKYKFCDNASFFIDEIAFIYDSMEYKDFPDCIAHFFSVHRHLSYNMIYTNSQSLSRIIKRVLCISEEFWNVVDLKKLLCFIRVEFKITTDIRNSKDSENSQIDENFKYEYYTKWFTSFRVYKAYHTKYLEELNKELPLYDKGCWNGLKMAKKDIIDGFIITQEEKEELKRMIF